MTKSSSVRRRFSPRAAATFAFATALLAVPFASASAQTLGYVPMQPQAYPMQPQAYQQGPSYSQGYLSEPAQTADEAVARSNSLVKRRPAALAKLGSNERPEDVNALLDKISRHGLSSLTMEERRLLEDVSRRLRGN